VKGVLEAFGFGRYLADATFATPPQIQVTGATKSDDDGQRLTAIGSVALGNFAYKNVPLLGLTAEYAWDGQRTLLRDVRLRHATGELNGEVLDVPGDFRLNVQSTINPAPFRGLVSGGLRKFLDEWEWPRSPTLRAEVRGTSRDPATWRGEGAVTLPRTRFRGVWANGATADVRFGEGAVTFDNLRVQRDEGVATGAFTYDTRRHEVRLDDIVATLKPTEAIYWIQPKFLKIIAPYRFNTTPKITANGVVHYRGGSKTRLNLHIDAPGGMDYDFLGKTLPFDSTRGQLLITDDRVQLLDVEGRLFGGELRGNADISTADGDPRYGARVALEGVDFPRLTKLYFDYNASQGQLSGDYEWTSSGNDTRTMRGTGQLRVANGDVFAIPVLGPLSGIISSILPGTGYSIAKQATASFSVSDGVIHTDDFKVSGKAFGLIGHGDIHFLERRLDFDVRLSASGAGVVLTPVYKLFEIKGEGSLAKPRWHAKNF
jgi:hypothetical protein